MDGVDLYRALSAMLNVAGYSIEDFDLDEIAADISQVEKSVAQQFLEAPSQVQAAQDAQRQAVAIGHEALVAPFSVRIEAFVKRFSDEKLYLPGAGYVYPSQRHWMRKFIKSYLIANGTLPMGRHQVRVDGYSGGEHDFSDLAA